MSNAVCPNCCKLLERETEPSVLRYCEDSGILVPWVCKPCGKVFREKNGQLSMERQAAEMGVDLNSVITMGRGASEGKQETWERHWEHLARENPAWAARQINGLLLRALEAEAALRECEER